MITLSAPHRPRGPKAPKRIAFFGIPRAETSAEAGIGGVGQVARPRESAVLQLKSAAIDMITK
jgi:hypothetical protein